MAKSGVVMLLSLGLLGNTLAGSLSDFEDAVAKPPKSSPSHHVSHDDDDDSFLDVLTTDCAGNVFAGVIIGTFKGIKWLFYDWWADPDVQYEGLEFEDPSDPASSNYIPPPAWETEPSAEEVEPIEDHDTIPVEDRFSGETYELEEGNYTEPEPEFADEVSGHQLGSAVVPYLRADYRWQYLDHDSDADDVLVEAGYKAAAFYGRYTRYEDRAAEEQLDISQYYGMFRFGGMDESPFAGFVQLGIGAGGYIIDGEDNHSGPALTVPVMVYPADWWGIEFRPAWALINNKTVGDYDISVSMGYRYLQLRAGYRWFWVQHEGHWLNGPYTGLSISF